MCHIRSLNYMVYLRGRPPTWRSRSTSVSCELAVMNSPLFRCCGEHVCCTAVPVAHFCQCGCQFGAFGATLRPIWSVLDPAWSILGALWRVLRVTSGPLWLPLDASQANLAALGSNRGPKGPGDPEIPSKSSPKGSQHGAKILQLMMQKPGLEKTKTVF